MPRTSTKRRLRAVESNDVEPMSLVLRQAYNAVWDQTELQGEAELVVLDEDSPFWVALANQLDVHLRAEAPPARHRRSDD